ncbi:hypothetical protein N7532_000381 [Penicillium argentinense]|uniref:Uncharacterized protein n=1 Tax=Penicillium argentinense TaxID=1131581 RepID=A0A9W9KNT6_9EURO|nr:uncharacterized protein N7532_000381 [Penicillium argentinense]KAJ5112336.1 hypothetical protein N7532_000381 [Penicillium argentinense]
MIDAALQHVKNTESLADEVTNPAMREFLKTYATWEERHKRFEDMIFSIEDRIAQLHKHDAEKASRRMNDFRQLVGMEESIMGRLLQGACKWLDLAGIVRSRERSRERMRSPQKGVVSPVREDASAVKSMQSAAAVKPVDSAAVTPSKES